MVLTTAGVYSKCSLMSCITTIAVSSKCEMGVDVFGGGLQIVIMCKNNIHLYFTKR